MLNLRRAPLEVQGGVGLAHHGDLRQRREGGPQPLQVDFFGRPEEIEIAGHAVPQVERDRGTAR